MKYKVVPTLSEVVNWPPTPSAAPEPIPAPTPTPVSQVSSPGSEIKAPPLVTSPPPPMPSVEQLSQRVMADLQKQIDLMLEQRLREILTPLLQRSADSLVRDARSQLATTLSELVTRAVAQELARMTQR